MTDTVLDKPVENMLDTFRLRDAPGHLLRRCQQRHVGIFAEEVGPDGPTPRQFAILLTIHQNPGLIQADLGQRTGIDRSTVADMVNRLVRQRLVQRRRAAWDGRAWSLYLTAKGRERMRKTTGAVQRTQRRILAPLPPKDRPVVLAYLRRLAGIPEVPD